MEASKIPYGLWALQKKENSVIYVYSPTLYKDEEIRFMRNFINTSIPRDNMIIIGEEWNKHIGHDTIKMNSVTGKYGRGPVRQ